MSGRSRAALVAHVRSRSILARVVAAAALAVSALAGALPEPTEQGVAAALGAATGSGVAAADVVWEPSRGAMIDALWGRGVAFLARAAPAQRGPGPGLTPGLPPGPALRDAFRARMRVTPGGRPLRVAAVERRTDTPGADEHDLVARGSTLAWLTRGTGGEHGATVLVPATSGPVLERAARLLAGAGLPPREAVLGILRAPRDALRAELRNEGLGLALGAGDDRAAALLDPQTHTWTADPPAAQADVVALPPAPRVPWTTWRPPPGAPPLDVPPEGLALDADGVFPPPLPPTSPAWVPLAPPRTTVPGNTPAPAPVARVELSGRDVAEGGPVVLHAFDTRQLAIRVVPGPGRPRATSGLPGSGVLAAPDAARAVAIARVVPLVDGGALHAGREVAPMTRGAPAIAAGEDGAPAIGPFSSLAVGGGAIETPERGGAGREGPSGGSPDDEGQAGARLAGWCATATAVVVATSERGSRPAIRAALEPLECTARVWVDDAAGAAAPRLVTPERRPIARPEGFVAFVHRELFPEGRPETWVASPGRQPAPAFRPAILETSRETLGAPVRVVAFGPELSWIVRAGTGERSHRAGGTFPESLEDPLRQSAVATLGLGIGIRRRPAGLTIGGSTGHRYASLGGVIVAGPVGLQLVRSAEVRADPEGDATELPLTVDGGELTPASRKRGLLHERADLCVLPDRTVLVASARFDSHEAGAETLLRLGCTDVVALDRGIDAGFELARPVGAESLPAEAEMTRLIVLDPGAR